MGEAAIALKELTIELYEIAAAHARDCGIILADTKFEFGLDDTGAIVLGDEALTPDSSRFWPADTWSAGVTQASFDKQYLRDYLISSGWDRESPPPALPDEVVAKTRGRYLDAYSRITGKDFINA